MWFKNLLIYHFTQPLTVGAVGITLAEGLADALEQHPFTPCGSQDRVRAGWAPPIAEPGEPLVESIGGRLLVCLQVQEKILPPKAVREAVADKVAEIKQAEGRAVGRKERQEIKDQAVFEMLPHAFTATRRTLAYVDTVLNMLVVNAGSYNRAEELISCLREAVGSLPLLPVKAHNIPENTITHWLLNPDEVPAGFTIGGDCELRDRSDDSAILRGKNVDLDSEEIRHHLNAGMYATKVELSWNDSLMFIVDAKLAIKRIRFDDLIVDQVYDQESDTREDEERATFAIASATLAKFIPALLGALGGADSGEVQNGH